MFFLSEYFITAREMKLEQMVALHTLLSQKWMSSLLHTLLIRSKSSSPAHKEVMWECKYPEMGIKKITPEGEEFKDFEYPEVVVNERLSLLSNPSTGHSDKENWSLNKGLYLHLSMYELSISPKCFVFSCGKRSNGACFVVWGSQSPLNSSVIVKDTTIKHNPKSVVEVKAKNNYIWIIVAMLGKHFSNVK